MTLDEFYDEPRKPAKGYKPTEKKEKETSSSLFNFSDEVLPDNVIKSYIGGEIVYMRVTEDGRVVRMDDDWCLPGIVG